MRQAMIGVFGAAFDPPTFGHKNAIEQCLTQFDSVLLIPSAAHAFGKAMSSFDHRLAMLRLFNQELAHPKVIIDTLELDLAQRYPDKPVYSYDLMEALEEKYPKETKLKLILGPDNKPQWHRFYRHQEFDERWEKYFVEERVHVHSIDVRTLIKELYLDPAECRAALIEKIPATIADYILEHGLYRPSE